MMRGLLGEPLRVHARMHRLNACVNAKSLALATCEYAEQTAIVSVAWKHAATTQASLLLAGDAGEAWYEGTLTRGTEGRLRMSAGGRITSDEHP